MEKLPFYEDKDSQMLCVKVPNGERPTIPKVIDPGTGGLWELVQECWSHEPSKRPPSPDILSRLNSIVPTGVNTQLHAEGSTQPLTEVDTQTLAEVNTQTPTSGGHKQIQSGGEYPSRCSRPLFEADLLQRNKYQYVASYVPAVLLTPIFQPQPKKNDGFWAKLKRLLCF